MTKPTEYLMMKRGAKWTPYYDRDRLLFDSKFKDGDTAWFTIRKPRNSGHHSKLFVLMDFTRDNTVAGDLYQGGNGSYNLLKAIMRMIGEVDEVRNINGTVQYEAKSISFDSMGQDKFDKLYQDIFNATYHTFFFGSDISYIRSELMIKEEEIRAKLEGFA